MTLLGASDALLPDAISQWTSELARACQGSRVTSAFLQSFQKRAHVQALLHSACVNASSSSAVARTALFGGGFLEDGPSSVIPFSVRVGVLSLFPLIESVAAMPGPQHEKLCDAIIGIFLQVLSSQKPASLVREPSDCLQAFHDFALNLLEKSEASLRSPRVQAAAKCLVALAVCSGDAGLGLSTVHTLLRAHAASANAPPVIDGSPLAQLAEFKQDVHVPSLTKESFLADWQVEGTQRKEMQDIIVAESDPLFPFFSFLSFRSAVSQISHGSCFDCHRRSVFVLAHRRSRFGEDWAW